jgi:hypothetical protein
VPPPQYIWKNKNKKITKYIQNLRLFFRPEYSRMISENSVKQLKYKLPGKFSGFLHPKKILAVPVHNSGY